MLIKLFAKLTSFRMQEKNFPEALNPLHNILTVLPCVLFSYDTATCFITLLNNNTEINLAGIFTFDQPENVDNIFQIIPAYNLDSFKVGWNKCIALKENEKYSFVTVIQRKQNTPIHVTINAHSFNTRLENETADKILISLSEMADNCFNASLSHQTSHQETNVFENEQFEFLYKAIHDLQAPLRKLSSFVELLFSKLPVDHNSALDTYKTKINLCKEEMSTLLEDLNTFYQSKQKPNGYCICDLNAVVKTALLKLKELQYINDIMVEYKDLPSVEGDKDQLVILFQKIFLNAFLSERENAKPVINVEAEEPSTEEIDRFHLSEKDKYYKIVIRDGDINFPPEYEEKIFEPFFRFPNRRDRLNNGLSLAICKNIAENQHGKIYASSKENYGTQITLILPAKQQPVC